jgi:hypothetical protein
MGQDRALQADHAAGIPSSLKDEATANKTAWARKHLGEHVEVRCCLSKLKCTHAEKDDILIDDWEKYRHLWEAKGARWITHVSAAETDRALAEMGL